ncbi:squalene/phytoene synthase family protein [Citricoccus sp. I39-566]|uniref:phytoene/squalene synthase family protein n=1 Tax=Citricoccus sp. I39-566 TaxID=3073268 RepID=UPI00286BAF57|nr:squalene/phytoene synthase family protein [Citricoccus sp. I39-566]WMY78538.1 squalene/phytoene synthase family protein [Citricoccus sp. I39-566]
MTAPSEPTAVSRYDRVAQASAAQVISGYSTSFGWATRLLAEPVRSEVRSIYALVRVADEIVDDPDPALTPALRSSLLEGLEAETLRALDCARSANLVVHAFAGVARHRGIDPSLVGPFFASMRADLTRSAHDGQSLSEYVYGSAEVVGLMCLKVFTGGDAQAYERLAPAARSLGSAFQKVNFLRDLADDHDVLGRTYFPGLDPATFTDAHRNALLEGIDADLATAAAAIPHLPSSCRRAVQAAHDLFAALSRRLRRTPAADIRRTRVRVPDTEKALILLRAMAGRAA